MILKHKPNYLVRRNKHRRIKGQRRGGVWFRFDENGFVELDESKLHPREINALKAKFEVVEKKAVKEDKTMENPETAIRQKAKKAGIKSWHVKSIDRLLKELEE